MTIFASTTLVAFVPAEAVGPTRLWRAVLARLLLDAFGFDTGIHDRDTRRLTVDRARVWLTKPTHDRDMVLDLAGLAPADLARVLPKLHPLWTLADRDCLTPEQVGLRGRRRSIFGRSRQRGGREEC